MSIINVSKNNLHTVTSTGKPILLDFYASWCSPCRAVSKILDEISKEREDFIIAKINVEEEKELADSFGIKGIPTLVVIKDSKITNRSTGMRTKKQILEMI